MTHLQPPDGSALREAIEALSKEDTDEGRNRFFAVLRASTLVFAPTTNDPTRYGMHVADGRERLRLRKAQIDGKDFLLAFSDLDAMAEWNPHQESYISMQAVDAFAMVLRTPLEGIFINPGGPPCGYLTQTQIQMLVDGITNDLDA
jgi:hypothetical protein